MIISQVNSGSPLPKNNLFHPQTAITSEQAAAFEASLDEPSETTGNNLSQGQHSPDNSSPGSSQFPIAH